MRFWELIGCRPDQEQDVLRSEASARATLSRRGLFAAAGAVAAGAAFSFAAPTQAFTIGVDRAAFPVRLSGMNEMLKRLYPTGRIVEATNTWCTLSHKDPRWSEEQVTAREFARARDAKIRQFLKDQKQ